MSLFEQLAALPAWLASLTLYEWIFLLTATVTLCSGIAAMTPTPRDDAVFAKLYKVVDFLALNFGRAKELPPILPPAKPASKAKPKASAKKLAILLPILLVLSLSACSLTDAVKQADQPREQWALASASYAGAVATVTELAKAGKLDLATAEKVEKARLVARAALDEAKTIIDDPGRSQADALWWAGRATSAVGALIEALGKARGSPGAALPLLPLAA